MSVMSLLDAHIPQLVASQSAFAAKAGLMRSTIGQAEQETLSAQAFHAGDSAAGFQAAHARFVAGTHEANTTSILARDQAEAAKWGG
jgi:uncharacterized protein YukE